MIYRLYILLTLSFFLGNVSVMAQATDTRQQQASVPAPRDREQEERNKVLARRFLEEVWMSGNLSAVDELVAPTYVAHDIGDAKGVIESADEQKQRAGFWNQNGTMISTFGYQLAEGDLVATYHEWEFRPNTLWMKVLGLGVRRQIPIINVFRFQDGKIVEMWNHRHDVDSYYGSLVFLKGLGVGLIPSLILAVVAFVLWRKLRKLRYSAEVRGMSA